MKINQICIILVVSLIFSFSKAMDFQNNNYWLQANIKKSLNENFEFNLEIQNRYSESLNKSTELFIRPSLIYLITDDFNASLGYLSLLDGEQNEIEKRPWAQLAYKLKTELFEIPLITFQRFRYENRILPESPEQERARVFLRVQTNYDNSFNPFASAELFTNNKHNGLFLINYQQKRYSVGLTKTWSKMFQNDLFIMRQVIDRGRDVYFTNLGLAFNFSF